MHIYIRARIVIEVTIEPRREVVDDAQVHRESPRQNSYCGSNLLAMLGIKRFTPTAHCVDMTFQTIKKENRMACGVARELKLTMRKFIALACSSASRTEK